MQQRIQLMEMVRAFQVGAMSRRQFLAQAGATVGSAAALTLLAACAASPADPPPVVDATAPPVTPGVTTTPDGTTTGIVTYSGPAGAELMGYLADPGGDSRRGVIVLQEWWGLNDHIKAVADRFAAAGYVALAPDLYGGVVTTEPDEARKEAMALGMRDAVAEIQAAAAYLRARPSIARGVGIVGFCMGGGLVYQTLADADAPATTPDAGVAFYGSPVAPSAASRITAPLMTHLGSADGIPAERVTALHTVLDEAGVPNAFHLYDGAQHAFFNDTRASYDVTAAATAWDRTLAWFDTHLD